jgi:predicted RND superfamily exporter protein
MRDFFAKHSPKIKGLGEFKPAGGVIGIHAAINDSLEKDHIRIDITILVAIFLICALCFRSFLISTFVVIPLIVANIIGFGLMSLMGLSLTIDTIPIAAVGIGIGVDFSIYLHSRYKEEYIECKDLERSLINGATSVGRAVLFIALVMIIPLSI